MRQLLILRHANALPGDADLPDHARPLSPRGREAAHAMRDAMRQLSLRPDLALVSSSRRTIQTLQSLAPAIAPEAVELMDALYLASAHDILHVLRQVTPTMHNALLIGHNPGLHDLALMLCNIDPRHSTAPGAATLAEDYPPTALAQFDVPDDWGALGQATGTLRRVLTPEDLPLA